MWVLVDMLFDNSGLIRVSYVRIWLHRQVESVQFWSFVDNNKNVKYDQGFFFSSSPLMYIYADQQLLHRLYTHFTAHLQVRALALAVVCLRGSLSYSNI